MVWRLDGKRCVITGAASGIGREAALMFAERGVRGLILMDRDEAGLRETADALAGAERVVTCCPCDLGREAEAACSGLEHVLNATGHIDVLINSAGLSDENEPHDAATWARVVSVNLMGTVAVTRTCLRHLADGGRIINVSSILGRAGKVRNSAYCTSKHGMLGFTKALALDLASRGITVNAVLPAWIDTPMLRRELGAQAALLGTNVEQLLRNVRKSIPLRRLISARETAELIAFLASECAGGITAQSLVIDGGYTCGM